jgi:hypothetical protein
MAQPARDRQISRRSWLMAGVAIPLFRARGGDSFAVTFDGDNLHVSAPALHFVWGKPLERLKDGASVVFYSQLTLFYDAFQTVMRRSQDRFVVSYALWEERFSVTELGSPQRSAEGLSAAGAEAWCLESLAISTLGLSPSQPFWFRFELRTADPKESSLLSGDPGISLRTLIDLFSRKPKTNDPQWTREAGPLRLADLVRTRGRGTRSG